MSPLRLPVWLDRIFAEGKRGMSGGKCWANGLHDHLARYRWTFALSGNVVYLCEECCAAFRVNAVADPSLGASRITQIWLPGEAS